MAYAETVRLLRVLERYVAESSRRLRLRLLMPFFIFVPSALASD